MNGPGETRYIQVANEVDRNTAELTARIKKEYSVTDVRLGKPWNGNTSSNRLVQEHETGLPSRVSQEDETLSCGMYIPFDDWVTWWYKRNESRLAGKDAKVEAEKNFK